MRLMSSLCAGRVRSSALSKNSTPLRGIHREYFIYLTLSFLKWLGRTQRVLEEIEIQQTNNSTVNITISTSSHNLPSHEGEKESYFDLES